MTGPGGDLLVHPGPHGEPVHLDDNVTTPAVPRVTTPMPPSLTDRLGDRPSSHTPAERSSPWPPPGPAPPPTTASKAPTT
ncbi:hypothetical protein ACFQMH_24650 [Streptomyces viridiviolaceus]|uniref:Uncharacterized protein n=1 Tax=Streptomyces viridiviolaceus TaxID=68282 RepID=A0ABW2E4B2_9ACTN|nr:hypothetical protein [Streptomyces viridiviolaceus]